MATGDKSGVDSSHEFDFKHRVTGAAVLIAFGVVFLPWLLGPPSEAKKEEVEDTNSEIVEVPVEQSTEDNLLADLLSEEVDIEETVYISKITPLSNLDNAGSKSGELVTPEALGDTTVKETEQELQPEPQSNREDQVQESLEADLNDSAPQAPEQQAQADEEIESAVTAQAEPPTSTISVGWVVQVGLFTDRSRAESLIRDLRRQGFNASSTVVDTNRGKNTGTRVWLGPFEKRVGANREKERLKREAEKEGFVRVYP